MNESHDFQRQTIKAIADLQETFGQTLSRQLALGALMKAVLGQVPLAGLVALQEEYEAEVDHQAASLAPQYQRPQFWSEWSELIEARRKQLLHAQNQATHPD